MREETCIILPFPQKGGFAQTSQWGWVWLFALTAKKQAYGCSTPRWYLRNVSSWSRWQWEVARLFPPFPLPCYLKPCEGGQSLDSSEPWKGMCRRSSCESVFAVLCLLGAVGGDDWENTGALGVFWTASDPSADQISRSLTHWYPYGGYVNWRWAKPIYSLLNFPANIKRQSVERVYGQPSSVCIASSLPYAGKLSAKEELILVFWIIVTSVWI